MLKRNWWKYYFNKDYMERYYFLLDEKRARKEVDFIINVLKLKKKDKIMDVCCGWGRHMIELATRGYDMTGVDYSSYFLKFGEKIADRKGIKVNFIHGDIRRLPLKVKFDAVLNLFTSFGYFSDVENEKIIKDISKLLKRKGKFIIDIPNVCYFLLNFKRVLKYKKNGKTILENHNFNPITFRDYLKIKVTGKNKQENLGYILRFYSFPEIKDMLKKNGLKIKKVYGSYKEESFNLDSNRMIIAGEKE